MPYISQFLNRVINADCLAALPQLQDGSVDFVLTDPPYLVGYHDRHGRSIANDVDGQWLKPAFAEVFRVLKSGRFCVSFYGWHKADEFLAAWRSAGFRPVGHLVWVKSYASKRGLLASQHEQAYLLAKGQAVCPAFQLPDVLEWQYTGNVLHPTQKPVRSLKPVIEAFTRRGEVVLDPFCGSGSTLLAAKILGRRYVGIDLDEAYCQTARRRL
jgi:site-specific DNA-methyltransferase (adenine-specific)